MDEKKNTDYVEQDAKAYLPLIMLIFVSALVGAAYTQAFEAQSSVLFMHGFMGFFFCVFALLKLFDPGAFANGFQMYDLLAKRARAYAYIYPYLELTLGLGYFSQFYAHEVYIATLVLMLFSACGVVWALMHHLKINCPCMGNILKVPLSTVTLTEDIGMALMAAMLLFGH